MSQNQQLPLFPQLQVASLPLALNQGIFSGRDLGTFKDSMKAPIHRWFRYPAGYSFKFVFESFDLFGVNAGDWVYDPFSGTGTTLICAKQAGVNGYGVEAHSFVHWVASVKLHWEFERLSFVQQVEEWLHKARQTVYKQLPTTAIDGVFPELIYKCYHPHDLAVLYLLREFVADMDDLHLRDFFKLGLTDTLRGAAAAGTGWPYISPRQVIPEVPKNALGVFVATIRQMVSDWWQVSTIDTPSQIDNVLGDSRQPQALANQQIKLAITSPPYLNNYDYADRTRLETYFWGIAHTWGDITRLFRDKLMTAATTQVTRSHHSVDTVLDLAIQSIAPKVYTTLQTAVRELSARRLTKGGKKDYDLMTALYFNDMLQVLQETYRVLDKGGHFLMVLGDSAPYGVHLATERLIGDLALGVGFSEYEYDELRQRGTKWKDNPQRHKVPLREGVLLLRK